MELRPYQIECLDAIEAKAKEGLTRQMVVLPTGAGKTVIFSELIKRKKIKTLVIAHRLELLEQAEQKLKMVAPDLDVGILCGKRKDIGKQVTIASIQSASNTLDLLKSQDYQLLIIDEAHHAAAKTYQKLVEHLGFRHPQHKPSKEKDVEVHDRAKPYLDVLGMEYRKASPKQLKVVYRKLAIKYHPDKNGGDLECAEMFKKIQEAYEFLIKRDHLLLDETSVNESQENDPSKPVVVDHSKLMVGFTATTKRGDKLGLDHLFQEVVFSMSIKKLVNRGFLVKPEGLHVKVGIDLKKVRTEMGDFKKKSLRKVMLSDQARDIVVETIKRFAADRRGIVFSVDIDHAEMLKQDIQTAGFNCDVVHSKVSPKDRKQRLEDFASGKLQFIVNPMILTEGFDCPRADCMINAAPTKNRSLYIQKAGRILRTHPDKNNGLLIDFGMTKKKHKLVTAIDLMGDKIVTRTITDHDELYPPPPKKKEVPDVDLKASNEKHDPLERKNKIIPIFDHDDWGDDLLDPYSWPAERISATLKQKEFIKKLGWEIGEDLPYLYDLGIGQAKKIITYLLKKKKEMQKDLCITNKQFWYLKKRLKELKICGISEEKISSLSKANASELIGKLKALG